jgi:asparaginyl-tRNA synthetase
VIGAATRVRHTLAQAIHRFFDQNGFLWVNTPIITSSDAEGGALFRCRRSISPTCRADQGRWISQGFFGREAF